MSRFFRSNSSSGSSTSESGEEDATEEVSGRSFEVSRNNSQDADSIPLDALALERPRNGSGAQTKDMLLHTLLEQNARHRVIEQRRRAGKSVNDKAAVDRETREQYRHLVDELSKYHLASHGLDDDRHAPVRQRVGEGLDRIATSAPSPSQAAVLQASQLLLMDVANRPSVFGPGSSSSLLDVTLGVASQVQSRYLQDFEEISVLGRGGFGEVYQVRHKLDNQVYAVKKIPIRPSTMSRIANEGQAALDELLAEVRSLSRLQHPNVVRYHSSWVEWTTQSAFAASSSGRQRHDSQSVVSESREFSSLNVLGRVHTQSDTNEDMGFTFEASDSQRAINSSTPEVEFACQSASTEMSHSVTDFTNGALLSTEPTLALHLQMSVHPMTLADFITPSRTDSMVKPLAHCFHIEPSLRILLALLDGVEYLHAEGVVHRDLKPANIFLRHEGNLRGMQGCVDLSSCSDCRQAASLNPATLSVCIGDFGLVTQIAEPETPSSPAITAVGTEIYRPADTTAPTSRRLDIFALGIVACELLCKFGTQMERRQTLQALRKGVFPDDFASCAAHHCSKVKDCVAAMLDAGDDKPSAIPDLKRRVSSLLEQIQKAEIVEVQRSFSA